MNTQQRHVVLPHSPTVTPLQAHPIKSRVRLGEKVMFNSNDSVNSRNNQHQGANQDNSAENTSTSDREQRNQVETKKSDCANRQWGWRKLFRLLKNASSVVSFIFTVIKILEELGLL